MKESSMRRDFLPSHQVPPPRFAATRSLPRLTVVSAVLGLSCAGASAYAQTCPGSAVPVPNGGFESGTAPLSTWPTTYGVWGVDGGSYVGPTAGVLPLAGVRMLSFEYTFFGGDGGAGADLYNLVDLSGQAALVLTGQAVAHLAANFNRVPGTATTGGPNERSTVAARSCWARVFRCVRSPLAMTSAGWISDTRAPSATATSSRSRSEEPAWRSET